MHKTCGKRGVTARDETRLSGSMENTAAAAAPLVCAADLHLALRLVLVLGAEFPMYCKPLKKPWCVRGAP